MILTENLPIYKKKFLSLDEAVAYFGIGIKRIRNMYQQKELSKCFKKDGRGIVVIRKEMENYILQNVYI